MRPLRHQAELSKLAPCWTMAQGLRADEHGSGRCWGLVSNEAATQAYALAVAAAALPGFRDRPSCLSLSSSSSSSSYSADVGMARDLGQHHEIARILQ